MAHALETVDKSKILIDHPLLTTTVGQYSYRIERKGTESSIFGDRWNGDGDDAHPLGHGRQFGNRSDLHS